MESKDELKEIQIKNCTCYHFDETRTVSDISFKGIERKITQKQFNL